MIDVEKHGVDVSNSCLLADVVFCIKVPRLIWNQFCSHLTIIQVLQMEYVSGHKR